MAVAVVVTGEVWRVVFRAGEEEERNWRALRVLGRGWGRG